jgi:hypothetical protein
MQAFEFKDYLYYSTDSLTFLRWKESRGGSLKDSVAGKLGYRRNGQHSSIRVQLHKKLYQAHRIIYELMVGKIPDGFVIDHVDGNPFNNLLENLQVKTPANNARNRKKHVNNTSGVAGVSLRKTNRGKNMSYSVSYQDSDGSRKFKNFSLLKYGKEQALRLATDWRDANITRLKELGFDYTDRNKE